MRRLAVLAALVVTAQAQTLTMARVGTGTIRAGSSFDVTVTLSGATAITALQWYANTPTGMIPIVLDTVGAATTASTKSLSCSYLAGTQKRCAVYGANKTLVQNGVLATLRYTTSATIPSSQLPITMTGVVAAAADGTVRPLAAGSALALTVLVAEDIDGDGDVDLVDLGLLVVQLLGSAPCSNDVNGDGLCNILDAQLVANRISAP